MSAVHDIWRKGERHIVSPASAFCMTANSLEAKSSAWKRLVQICRAILSTSAKTLSATAPRPLLNTLDTSPDRRNATIMRASQQSSSREVGSTKRSWPTVQILTQRGTSFRTGTGNNIPESFGSSRKISVFPVESWLSKLILGMLRSRRAIEEAKRHASNKFPP